MAEIGIRANVRYLFPDKRGHRMGTARLLYGARYGLPDIGLHLVVDPEGCSSSIREFERQ